MNEQDTVKQYHQIDTMDQPPQSTLATAMLTKWEADTKNRALRMNGSTLKYILRETADTQTQ
jgi:hypothetical protein